MGVFSFNYPPLEGLVKGIDDVEGFLESFQCELEERYEMSIDEIAEKIGISN